MNYKIDWDIDAKTYLGFPENTISKQLIDAPLLLKESLPHFSEFVNFIMMMLNQTIQVDFEGVSDCRTGTLRMLAL